MADVPALTRTEASARTEAIGWRYLLGELQTVVAVGPADVVPVVEAVLAAADHARVDVRPGRVEVSLQDPATGGVTEVEVAAATAVTAAVAGLGPGLVTSWTAAPRSVQRLEIAIDAMDIPAIRPFWKAVLAYADEPGHHADDDPIVDPARQGPAVWFQQMDAPRPQRNRIHLDVTVSHDEAEARVAAALAAGGRLLSDARARAFWVLADAEGNEACICTWQDRDPA
jgi:4a-hydroxytetrahydrobiopterin dehydratase